MEMYASRVACCALVSHAGFEYAPHALLMSEKRRCKPCQH